MPTGANGLRGRTCTCMLPFRRRSPYLFEALGENVVGPPGIAAGTRPSQDHMISVSLWSKNWSLPSELHRPHGVTRAERRSLRMRGKIGRRDRIRTCMGLRPAGFKPDVYSVPPLRERMDPARRVALRSFRYQRKKSLAEFCRQVGGTGRVRTDDLLHKRELRYCCATVPSLDWSPPTDLHCDLNASKACVILYTRGQ